MAMTRMQMHLQEQLDSMPVVRAQLELNLTSTGRAFPDAESGLLNIMLVILKPFKVPSTVLVQDLLELAVYRYEPGMDQPPRWFTVEASLQSDASLLRTMWMRQRCGMHGRRWLRMDAPSESDSEERELHRKLKELQAKVLGPPQEAPDVAAAPAMEGLEPSLADQLAQELFPDEDPMKPKTEDGPKAKETEPKKEDPKEDEPKKEDPKEDEPQKEDPKEDEPVEADPKEDEDTGEAETDDDAKGEASSPKAGNASGYQDYCKLMRSSELISQLPRPAQWPATRAMWAADKGDKPKALLALNQAFNLAGVPTLDAFPLAGVQATLVDLRAQVQALYGEAPRPGCPRRRWNKNGCPPSCLKRQGKKRGRPGAKAASSSTGL